MLYYKNCTLERSECFHIQLWNDRSKNFRHFYLLLSTVSLCEIELNLDIFPACNEEIINFWYWRTYEHLMEMIIFMTYITRCALHSPFWGLQLKHLKKQLNFVKIFQKSTHYKMTPVINMFTNYLNLLQLWYALFRKGQWRCLKNLQSPRVSC